MEICETFEEKGRVFEAFSRALVRESHNLMQRSDMVWQQLYNRLQWEDEPVPSVLQPEYERRTAPGATPWLRTRTPLRESAEPIRTLVGRNGGVLCCVFTPNGRHLVSGGEGGTVQVWDLLGGKQISVLHGHDGPVRDCTVIANGTVVVTVGMDGTLRPWAVNMPTGLGILLAVDGSLLACASSPWEGEVYAGGLEGILHAVALPQKDVATDCRTHRFSSEGGVGISAIAVSPDGSIVVCGHGDGAVSLWNPRASNPSRTAVLGYHRDIVFSATFSPDGTRVVTGDGVGVLRVWNRITQSLVTEVQAHQGVVNDVTISPDGRFIVSVSDDRSLKVWEFPTAMEVATFEGHYRPATCCGISPTMGLLASGSDDGNIQLWQFGPKLDKASRRIDGHTRWAVASAFSADGTLLVTGSRDGDMIVWDARTGEATGSLGPQPDLEWCELSPDGNHVVSCGDGVTLWDVTSGRRRAILWWSPPVLWCGFSPNGEIVAGLDAQGKRVWDITEPDPPFLSWADGTPPECDKEHGVDGPDFRLMCCRCAFSPFGSRIATPGPNGTVLVWEIDADRPRVLGKHNGEVTACAWDPEGQLVASAGEDKVIRLWNVRERTPSGTLEGHTNWVNHLGFLDRGLLVSASSDGTLRLWDTGARNLLCCHMVIGNVFISCATHPDHRWLCVTDIAGNVTLLTLEWCKIT